MVPHADNHVSADDLTAYADGDLAPDLEQRIEAHLAECDVCTAEARKLRSSLPAFDQWTARMHGDAYFRDALAAALSTTGDAYPAWRERIANWHQRCAGQAEAAIRVIIDLPRAAMRLAAFEVGGLIRPGAMLRLASADNAPVRTRGSVSRNGAGGTRGSVEVIPDRRGIVVRAGTPGGTPEAPLVLLIRTDGPSLCAAQQSIGEMTGTFRARFDDVEPGSYLIVIEPLVRPT